MFLSFLQCVEILINSDKYLSRTEMRVGERKKKMSLRRFRRRVFLCVVCKKNGCWIISRVHYVNTPARYQ